MPARRLRPEHHGANMHLAFELAERKSIRIA
jgi:hypothetical protein